MTLPLLLSVPHAGWRVPPEVADLSVLTEDEIAQDGDVGAREIYALSDAVAAYQTTEIARAFVDLNRAEDDRSRDGVVKTHTCWNVPVYREPLSDEVVALLLERYYHPYHASLRRLAGTGVLLGIDCHTMASAGPPVGPDPGKPRPPVCLSNADGTCPDEWIQSLARHFRTGFGEGVTINDPFQGGYITRHHAAEIPFVQLELSRAELMTYEEKRAAVLAVLEVWCAEQCG